MRHIVALSGGKDSVAMALRLAETEPQAYEYVITPTGNELPEMLAHWRKLAELLGAPLRPLSVRSLVGETVRQACLPNNRMRWCTRILKLEPFQEFIADAAPATSYVGIRADETDREGVDHEQIEGITNRYPLAEWGWGLAEVLRYLDNRGVAIPERTDCGLCFFQRLGEWWRLWRYHPDLYEEGVELEDYVSNERGKTLTLRSAARDKWPAGLRELRAEFEKGRVPTKANQPQFWGTSKRRAMCSVCAR